MTHLELAAFLCSGLALIIALAVLVFALDLREEVRQGYRRQW